MLGSAIAIDLAGILVTVFEQRGPKVAERVVGRGRCTEPCLPAPIHDGPIWLSYAYGPMREYRRRPAIRFRLDSRLRDQRRPDRRRGPAPSKGDPPARDVPVSAVNPSTRPPRALPRALMVNPWSANWNGCSRRTRTCARRRAGGASTATCTDRLPDPAFSPPPRLRANPARRYRVGQRRQPPGAPSPPRRPHPTLAPTAAMPAHPRPVRIRPAPDQLPFAVGDDVLAPGLHRRRL